MKALNDDEKLVLKSLEHQLESARNMLQHEVTATSSIGRSHNEIEDNVKVFINNLTARIAEITRLKVIISNTKRYGLELKDSE